MYLHACNPILPSSSIVFAISFAFVYGTMPLSLPLSKKNKWIHPTPHSVVGVCFDTIVAFHRFCRHFCSHLYGRFCHQTRFDIYHSSHHPTSLHLVIWLDFDAYACVQMPVYLRSLYQCTTASRDHRLEISCCLDRVLPHR